VPSLTFLLTPVCGSVDIAVATASVSHAPYYLCIPIQLLLACLHAGPHVRLCLYADGITPGSVLAPDNRRKSIVWYWSFIEFGDKLSSEETWTCVAVVRTCMLSCICV
jgi:hypothetical protein